jgi:O-antigen ligase
MPRPDHPLTRLKPRLPFALLTALLVVLWIAGGASRPDVLGQVVARGAAWAILIAFILFAGRPRLQPVAPVAFFLAGAVALVALQLVPLPPSLWTALPGRDLLIQAASVSGQEQPWRPLSISPGATFNALSSLIVPVVALLLLARLRSYEHWRIVAIILGLVVASSLLGLLHFSGTRFDHPLINDVRGMVSGSFANRNHFALFVAIGCLLAPAWAFPESRGSTWRGPAALALLILFGLIVLATGSRMGMIVGALGIGVGLFIVRGRVRSELARLPRKAAIALVVGVVALLVAAVILSVALGRAVSLDRALSMQVEQDLRRQALPVVVAMAEIYFPFGSGFGTFDPAYRIHEPTALLNANYFNRAHNDLLEVVLDGGLPSLVLLGTAIGWWLMKSLAVWRGRRGPQAILPRLGSAILLLIMIASTTDYPARTPMIMAITVIAAVWLHGVPEMVKKASGSSGTTRSTRVP